MSSIQIGTAPTLTQWGWGALRRHEWLSRRHMPAHDWAHSMGMHYILEWLSSCCYGKAWPASSQRLPFWCFPHPDLDLQLPRTWERGHVPVMKGIGSAWRGPRETELTVSFLEILGIYENSKLEI